MITKVVHGWRPAGLLAYLLGPGEAEVHREPRVLAPWDGLARVPPLGTVVTVEGTVTTPSGVFASSYDDEGFAIQDRTAGIFVSFPNTDIGVKPSRHVQVTADDDQPFSHQASLLSPSLVA